ncbi:MAG: methyltransferase domain-containing protein [Bacillaceae bacterium]|nr:methyltransferase domain-containing protein [Bacillaceae bacterium]
MKVTDFSKIAGRYDRNPYRHQIKVDDELMQVIEKAENSPVRVLDLACGTGIYLNKQAKIFGDKAVEWHGLDMSDDMLQVAKSKGTSFINYTRGKAEKMPYPDDFFDYVVSNYAFHHFEYKADVLNEIRRVLKTGGVVKVHNISIHEMKKWWVYQYFPAAYELDLKRFWEKERLYQEFLHRGFDVSLYLYYKMETIRLADYLLYAENRDISVLTLLQDEDYKHGLEQMKKDVHADPQMSRIVDFAELDCVARKQ